MYPSAPVVLSFLGFLLVLIAFFSRSSCLKTLKQPMVKAFKEDTYQGRVCLHSGHFTYILITKYM